MSLFATFLADQPAGRGEPPDHLLWSDAGGVRHSTAGIAVTPGTALSAGTVFACVRNIAEDIAKLPLILYRRLDPEGKERATDDPLYGLFHDEPNEESTSFNLRRAVTGLAILRGNGFAEIERDGAGRPLAVWWVDPKTVTPKRTDAGKLYYRVEPGNGKPGRSIWPIDLLHINGFTTDGIVGCMIASLGKETIGLTLAVERFAGSFFGNGAVAGMILMHPGKLSEPARKNLQTSFDEQTKGQNAHGTVVLEEGTKATQNTVNPEESQFLETRQFQVEDVCRWWRMPPFKVGHLARAAGWSTVEAANQDYVNDCLMPWAVCWEQEIKRKILADRPELFVEHLFDALLRGDTITRANSNEVRWRCGTLSIDEWRAQENMNPLPNGAGKRHFVQMQMIPVEDAGKTPPAGSRPAPPPDPDTPDEEQLTRIRRAGMRTFADAAARVIRKEVHAIGRMQEKDLDESGLAKAVGEFYAAHKAHVVEAWLAPALALADLVAPQGLTSDIERDIEAEIRVQVDRHTDESINRVVSAFSAGVPLADDWLQARVPLLAQRLVDRIITATIVAAGVTP